MEKDCAPPEWHSLGTPKYFVLLNKSMKWLVEVKCECLYVREQNERRDEFHTLIDMGQIKTAGADTALEMREYLKDPSL